MLLSDSELLERLVAFDSTSTRGNRPIAEYVCDYLDRPGIEVTPNASADGSRVNVIAIRRPAGAEGAAERGGLTLCGHLDVVPADEPEWSGDPFTLRERDGTLVGRGACDMKGSVALAMNLLGAVEPARLRQPLAALFTFDEELGSLGAQHFCATWHEPLPAQVVVGEPTSLRAVRMHKGHMAMGLTVLGRAAHSGSPHLGANAIDAAARIVQGLGRLAETFKQSRLAAAPGRTPSGVEHDMGRFFPSVPFHVLNVVRIHGGSAINVVPERCVIELGLRVLPGANEEAVVAWIRDTVAKSAPGVRHELEIINNNPPLLCPEEAAVHAGLCALLGQTQSYGVSFASDAGVLAQQGHECVLFGPGSIEVAHRPDEFVPIDELARARTTLERLLEKFCL